MPWYDEVVGEKEKEKQERREAKKEATKNETPEQRKKRKEEEQKEHERRKQEKEAKKKAKEDLVAKKMPAPLIPPKTPSSTREPEPMPAPLVGAMSSIVTMSSIGSVDSVETSKVPVTKPGGPSLFKRAGTMALATVAAPVKAAAGAAVNAKKKLIPTKPKIPDRFKEKAQRARGEDPKRKKMMALMLNEDLDTFDREEAKGCHERFRRVVGSKYFDLVFGFLVLLNGIFMGWEMQVSPQAHDEMHFFITYVDLVFLTVFTLELLARILAFGPKPIVTNGAMLLDATIVCVGNASELIIPYMSGNFLVHPDEQTETVELGPVKNMRALRVMRAIRVLRMMTMFDDLYDVLQLFLFSIKPLFWMVLFMMMVLFVFAMFAISFVGRGDVPHIDDPDELAAYMDTVESFKYTLSTLWTLMSIMRDDGMDVVNPLLVHNPVFGYLWFMLYLPIAGFVLMNMITAVVVDKAGGKTSRDDFNADVRNRMYELGSIFAILQHTELDDNMSNHSDGVEAIEITKEVFLRNAKRSEVFLDILTQLGLDIGDLSSIYDGMDLNGDGNLDFYEFSEAYLRLKKLADDRDIVALMKASETTDERRFYMHHILKKGAETQLLMKLQDQLFLTHRAINQLRTKQGIKIDDEQGLHELEKSRGRQDEDRVKDPTKNNGIGFASGGDIALANKFGGVFGGNNPFRNPSK